MSKKKDILLRLEEWVLLTGKRKREVAELLGMSPQQLSRLLSGADNLGTNMQSRLETAGVDIDWIMTGRKAHEQNPPDAKGEMIARYFIPQTKGLRSIVVETEKSDEGFTISVYGTATAIHTLPKPAANTPQFENDIHEMDMEFDTPPPPVRIKKAAATPVHTKGKG